MLFSKPSLPALVWAAAAAVALAVLGSGVQALDMAAMRQGHHVQAVSLDVANDLQAEAEAAEALWRRDTTNLQTFTGSVGGVTADPITQSDSTVQPYEVAGDTFSDYDTAAARSCDNQHNSCADAANSNTSGNVTVADCDEQNTECKAAAASATQTAFTTLTTSDAEFDYFCEL